ncbi:thiamine transporter 1 isoform X2 [Drosophila grimshawi]|uniref:thiamine transporter 1 isoform X2 n=1 Tax=Drosophila grimshawi TaxID=7222 RepID=UPI000C871600|nr:thiamine transporter 1 isoform X2 [Drosophila grimshawi]
MKEWFKISCLLCVFGFVREIRPSEPYVTEFILGPWRNITEQQLVQDVYPVGTYSNLVQLVFVFLITDFLRYKPLIITIGAAGVIIWSMLIWTTSLLSLQILEFFYGTYMAAEVAYYTYIYAKVDKKYYPRVTSHTRAAMFGGKLISGITSQLMINLELMDYKQLNYITLTTQIIAMLWAFGLPKVDKSLYFHREANAIESTPEARRTSQLQVETQIAWNGAVDAVLTALAAMTALAAGYLHNDRVRPRVSLLVLSLLSALEGGSILICCWTHDIYWSYVGFVIFGALYGFTITVASAEVARNLQEESFGLVFGINTLLALVFQSLLTVIVVSETGFELAPVGQYTVYAFYFIAVAIIYLISVLTEHLWNRRYEKDQLKTINLE